MENKPEKNSQDMFILKKTERLTSAVYLVTDFFDSRESLKWELRKKSLSFLSFTNSFFHENDDGVKKSNASGLIKEILILLHLARNAFLLSQMNFSILTEEYRLLSGAMNTKIQMNKYHNDFEFPEKFFATAHDAPPMKPNTVTDKTPQNKEFLKDAVIGHPDLSSEYIGAYGENVVVDRKDIRRETIVKMLRAKGEITIKDISHLVRGVSEKTIQRELLAMVAEGILTKEGERRWSRYLMKNDEL